VITEIFYHTDNFCKAFETEAGKNFLTNGNHKRKKSHTLSLSEIMTILIYYHYSGYKILKDYYMRCVQKDLKNCFKKFVS